MPINAHPEYIAAEGEYLKATTLEEKIEKLKKMISYAPSHKGGENLRANLKARLKRLQEQLQKTKTNKRISKPGIKKEEFQAVIIGKTNSGKSSLISILTNAKPKISSNSFTTDSPEIGIMEYQTIPIQIIEIPPIESEYYDKGIVYTSDLILLLITSLDELKEIETKFKINSIGKKIVVFNKADILSSEEKRKITATLLSKKYNFVLISCISKEGIDELKEKIFKNFNKIRIYTKEPGKEFEQSKKKPMILPLESTIKDVAEKIYKGFSSKIKTVKIWGPSSKFPGQIVGLNHKVEDMDTVEFKTK